MLLVLNTNIQIPFYKGIAFHSVENTQISFQRLHHTASGKNCEHQQELHPPKSYLLLLYAQSTSDNKTQDKKTISFKRKY